MPSFIPQQKTFKEPFPAKPAGNFLPLYQIDGHRSTPISGILTSAYAIFIKYQLQPQTFIMNKKAFILSLIVLIVAFGVLSMTSVPKEFRYTWNGMNPWNGVEGLAFTVRYFLHTSVTVTYLVTISLIFLIWWRLYAIFNRIWR